MPCLGNGPDHCCYINGETCPYVIYNYTDETGHFRKYACFLRAELGDWDKVLEDQRYKDLKATGAWHPDLNCRDWPDGEWPNNAVCKYCGVGC